MRLKRNKKELTIEEKYRRLKKRTIWLSCIFAVFIMGVSYYTYLNFDYLVFKHLISQNYIYTDALDKLYEEKLGRDVNGSYYTYFDNMVIASVTEEIRNINNDKYTYQYTPEKYQKMKTDDKIEADESYTEELSSQTAYLKLSNFSSYTKDFLYDNSDFLSQYDNIIIDLRNNLGGDTDALNAMADLFLEKGQIIATDEARSDLLTKTYYAKQDAKLVFDNIMILQNEYSASASENFIAALKENLSNVTLIGSNTYGKGIGQITIPVTKGYALKATVFLWLAPKGECIHQIGIAPDISYDTEGDGIISYAQNLAENGK